MEQVGLSVRLQTIADMVSPGAFVCDVGCDHGFLPIYLVQNEKARGALAMDIVEGPLKAASEHIKQAGLENVIEVRQSDGLHALTRAEVRGWSRNCVPKGQKSSLIIAGMGGPLISKILSECPRIRDVFDEIIISPQSQLQEVRIDIRSQRLEIMDERMVMDAGKYYTVMRLRTRRQLEHSERRELSQRYARLKHKLSEGSDIVVSGKDRSVSTNVSMELLDEVLDSYGPVLLDNSDPVLKGYLEHETQVLNEIMEKLDPRLHMDRYIEVKKQIKINRYAGIII